MERKSKSSQTGSFMFGLVVGLLAVYVAGYFLCVEPTVHYSTHLDFPYAAPEPEYHYLGDVGDSVFAPIHAIDQKIRPDTWTSLVMRLNKTNDKV